MPPIARFKPLVVFLAVAGCGSVSAQQSPSAPAGMSAELAPTPTTPVGTPALPPVIPRPALELRTASQLSANASAATPAPVSSPALSIPLDTRFPRYDSLKPAVAFWRDVFGKYSELQSVIHSSERPDRVLTVLDFRAEAQQLNKFQLDNVRRKEETAAKARYEDLLRRVHQKQHAPETMTYEERRLYEMYPGRDAERFKRMFGTVRSQRGLQERTEQALQTADRYLPLMERTFAVYNLPPQLTRIPIVESSFNVEAYSKSHAAGMWQFIPSSARVYMRLDDVVDDRRDPWTSTDAAARHLRDDYALLQDWPLAITAYNHGRNGIARALKATNGTTLVDLIERNTHPRWGFAGKNYYAEFLAALDVEHEYRERKQPKRLSDPMAFETVETKHYVPYDTLRRLCGADDELFRRLNPAYRPEVIEGKLYVPPGHLIRVPAGRAQNFEVAYSRLGNHERFDSQRVNFLLHRVKKGEVLGRIAKQYGVSTTAILRDNGIPSANKLRIGQVLRIKPHQETRPGPITVAVGESKPSQTRAQKRAEAEERKADAPAQRKPRFKVHKVKSGQTLHSIARQYKVTISELRVANNLGGSSHIRVGQKLKVPLAS